MSTDVQKPLIDIPVSRKILLFSTSAFTFTLLLINRQRRSSFILHLASERALAGRALLLGTAASCSGVGVLMGSIATVMGVESFKEFRIKTDDFFTRHGIKRQSLEPDLSELSNDPNSIENF